GCSFRTTVVRDAGRTRAAKKSAGTSGERAGRRGGGFGRQRSDISFAQVPQRQAMQRRPQVNHIALVTALLVKALEDVGLQVDAEAAAATVAAMQRTST